MDLREERTGAESSRTSSGEVEGVRRKGVGWWAVEVVVEKGDGASMREEVGEVELSKKRDGWVMVGLEVRSRKRRAQGASEGWGW